MFAIRVAVAAAAVILSAEMPARIVAVVYLLWAVLVLTWRSLQRPTLGFVLLAIDAAMLAAMSGFFGLGLGWGVAAIWLVFVLAQAVLFHGWLEVAASAAICCLGFSWVQPVEASRILTTASALCGLLGAAAGAMKHQYESRLFKLSRQGVLYRAEALGARDAERERLANDFHDGPLQSFVSLQMRLEVVRRKLAKDHDAGMEELGELQALWKKQIDDVREFVRAIRQEENETLDLAVALNRFVEAFQKEADIQVRFSGTADLERLDPRDATEILQVVREGLHNIHKHAKASEIGLRLQDLNDGAKGALEIVMEDNGQGFPFAGTFTLDDLDALGKGPASIRRRVRHLNGSLTLDTGPGKGSRLEVRVPR